MNKSVLTHAPMCHLFNGCQKVSNVELQNDPEFINHVNTAKTVTDKSAVTASLGGVVFFTRVDSRPSSQCSKNYHAVCVCLTSSLSMDKYSATKELRQRESCRDRALSNTKISTP